ncbi:hypothetical protein [Acidocella sp.]|jgi:fructose-bisphosphate aldolase class II|uniref:hypothetical protein n=1 Tax=Acidocella sp. TaxID=50710 RepID=UPI002F4254D1
MTTPSPVSPPEPRLQTDLRLAMTAGIRHVMGKDKAEFDPRKFLQAALDEARTVCRTRFEAFGTAGQASRIRALDLGLDAMAQRYAKGELRQVVAPHAAAA